MKVKVLKRVSMATEGEPATPIRHFKDGEIADVSDKLGNRMIAIKFAKLYLCEEKQAKPVTENKMMDVSAIEETKEEPKKRGRPRKFD